MTAAKVSLLVWLACSPPNVSDAKDPTSEEIQRAIERLGSDRFAEPSEFLWQCGRPAEKALQDALMSADLEVRLRAGVLVDKFRYGIFPDTPPETVALIQHFRRGDDRAHGLEVPERARPV